MSHVSLTTTSSAITGIDHHPTQARLNLKCPPLFNQSSPWAPPWPSMRSAEHAGRTRREGERSRSRRRGKHRPASEIEGCHRLGSRFVSGCFIGPYGRFEVETWGAWASRSSGIHRWSTPSAVEPHCTVDRPRLHPCSVRSFPLCFASTRILFSCDRDQGPCSGACFARLPAMAPPQ